MEKLIFKELIEARDIIEAAKVLRSKYWDPRIITFKFEKNMNKIPKEERHYAHRKMWVWFIKDVETIRKLV